MFPHTTHKPFIFFLFPDNSASPLSPGAIAGIVIAVIVAVVLVGALMYGVYASRYAVWNGTPRVHHAKSDLMMLYLDVVYSHNNHHNK